MHWVESQAVATETVCKRFDFTVVKASKPKLSRICTEQTRRRRRCCAGAKSSDKKVLATHLPFGSCFVYSESEYLLVCSIRTLLVLLNPSCLLRTGSSCLLRMGNTVKTQIRTDKKAEFECTSYGHTQLRDIVHKQHIRADKKAKETPTGRADKKADKKHRAGSPQM